MKRDHPKEEGIGGERGREREGVSEKQDSGKKTAVLGWADPKAGLGRAGLGRTELGRAGLGRTELGRAGKGWTGQGWTGLGSFVSRMSIWAR